MAAAEYFASGAQPSATYLAPPQPQRASSNPNVNGPVQYSHSPPFPSPQMRPTTPNHRPPPPYNPPLYGDEPKQRIHFAPPPAELPVRNSFSSQRPNPQQWNQRSYNPQAYPYQPPSHIRPYMNDNRSDVSLTSYSSDPEHSRRRHSNDKRKRRTSESSRSANADGFIGAAGGGIIGDLIFPGLGTVGGALVGWLGGKDYGQHRKSREVKMDKAQEKWERKYGSRDHSHSSDGRRRSRDHSTERRRSHDGRRDY